VTHPTHSTRRSFLAGASALACWPVMGNAQQAPRFVEFAARARALTGFDAIPREVLFGVQANLSAREMQAFTDQSQTGSDDTKAVLKTLYTGITQPQEDTAPERITYARALMYGAIEDSVNVPSYCGGAPGYWAQKPNVS